MNSESESFFLSYSRSDEAFALKLAKDLRSQGVAMWVDQLDIRPSEHWDRAIERAVTSCRGIVVIVSPRSVASDNVADEISYAIDSGKSVLPVKIEACTLPLRLTRKQVVDATGNYERALQQCLDELLRSHEPHVAPAPARPARVPLDAEAIRIAKQQLAPILGPIAARLVDKEAARAESIPELYAQLSQHIDASADRERFTALAPKAADTRPEAKPEPRPVTEVAQAVLPAAELESMTRLMTQYIGPIASVVVKRESKAAASIKELRHQLAEKIPHQRDRAEFLRLSGG
jgi:TIR domain